MIRAGFDRSLTRRPAIALAVSLAILVAGCLGRPADADGNSLPVPTAVASVRAPSSLGHRFPDFVIPRARLQEAINGAPPSQAAALADGKLSFAEYEAAVFAMASCVLSSGLGITFAIIDPDGNLKIVDGPVLNRRGRYEYGFLYYGPIASSETEIAACKKEFLERVELFWIENVAPTQRDIDAARRALAACMREAGEEIPLDATPADFSSYQSRPSEPYDHCRRRISYDFGLPGFGGN